MMITLLLSSGIIQALNGSVINENVITEGLRRKNTPHIKQSYNTPILLPDACGMRVNLLTQFMLSSKIG